MCVRVTHILAIFVVVGLCSPAAHATELKGVRGKVAQWKDTIRNTYRQLVAIDSDRTIRKQALRSQRAVRLAKWQGPIQNRGVFATADGLVLGKGLGRGLHYQFRRLTKLDLAWLAVRGRIDKVLTPAEVSEQLNQPSPSSEPWLWAGLATPPLLTQLRIVFGTD
jgi:hypothetical protein